MKSINFLLMVLSCCWLSQAFAGSQSPNIILIYTDDQGFGDVSYLNPHSKFQTPNMDRLAEEGIAFLNGHSTSSVCTPSRYGLLTGRYNWRTTLKKRVLKAEAPGLIEDGRMTLASMLRDNGYDTAMVGKWHLGMDFPGTPDSRDWNQPVTDMPLDKGFDYFYGIPASMNYGVLAWFEGRHARVPPIRFTAKKKNERHPIDYRIMPPYQATPEETLELLGKSGLEVAPDFVDNLSLTRFTDKAIQWLENRVGEVRKEKPFFLYLPYTSPHYPVCPLPEFHGQGDCGAYGEFIIETDHHIGRLLSYLQSSGLDDDTMIIFSSDNGPASVWKTNITEFDHHSNHSFRDGKFSIYEGGTRVPFFIRWPAGIQHPGRVWDKRVGQVDLLATLAELIGAVLPDDAAEDSQSFAPVLMDPKAELIRAPLVSHSFSGQFAITYEDWKLVLPFKKKSFELYNLSSDPGETNDVAARHPQQVANLKDMLTKIVLRGRTSAGKPQPNDTGYWPELTWITADEYKQESLNEM